MWRDGDDGRDAGPLLASAGALDAVAEAEFIDVDGTVRREPLSRSWSVAFERVPRCGVSRRFGGSGTGRRPPAPKPNNELNNPRADQVNPFEAQLVPQPLVCPVPVGALLLWGHAVRWLIGDRRRLRPFSLGQKRLGTFGSLPVRGGSSPVECYLPLVLVHVADPCRCCPLVHAGGTFVRLGRPAELLRAGGQRHCGGSVRLGRVTLGRFQPLANGGGLALNGVPASFSELLKPPADSGKPGVDLPPAALAGVRARCPHLPACPILRRHRRAELDHLRAITRTDDVPAGS